ncbi:DinB family protein [Olleya sp. AH-315-F22]|nr:DinB family protein [Olleya sp. AH-315-F22]
MRLFLIITVLIISSFSVNAQRVIQSEEGYSSQVGVIVSMLNDMIDRVERTVKDLSVEEIDFLLDENANSIGTLIMHLAATEKFYQVYTFEHRELNDEEAEWSLAMSMGKKAQEKYKGKDVKHYLEIFKKVRKKTLEYLKERDDEWLAQVPEGYRMNNHWSWYHVMEHQSSHLGQILLIKKRIPK